jgi:NADPH:quinone reductase-like Zn-dependent oxidoreductase
LTSSRIGNRLHDVFVNAFAFVEENLMSDSATPAGPTPGAPTGRRLRLRNQAEDVSKLSFEIDESPLHCGPGEVLVEVAAAAINPSDVKAALGLMPQAKWPRTPGRDFSGTIVEGRRDLLGLEVWGSSGELGIRADGSHGTHLVIGEKSVRAKPRALSLLEAGAIGVPFVTAWKGFERAGLPKRGDNVAVLGATGKVGQAAIQIATMLGARAFAIIRAEGSFNGHHSAPVQIVSGAAAQVPARVREMTNGHGADIVYNTVGSPYFEAAQHMLALDGRQILIATIDKVAPFNILEFYHGRHAYLGVDTLALSTEEAVSILAQLAPGFESGALRPFPIRASSIYALEEAAQAYARALSAGGDPIVIVPGRF